MWEALVAGHKLLAGNLEAAKSGLMSLNKLLVPHVPETCYICSLCLGRWCSSSPGQRSCTSCLPEDEELCPDVSSVLICSSAILYHVVVNVEVNMISSYACIAASLYGTPTAALLASCTYVSAGVSISSVDLLCP